METYFSYSSHLMMNSGDVDCPPSSNRVRLLCSYGGKIQFRRPDNHLSYSGGETKILTIDRSIRFSELLSKLSSLLSGHVYFKYQLPGEDLDALISVTNDEDIEHMMFEYDRLHRSEGKAARLRVFLFPLIPLISESKFDCAGALNSMPIRSPPPSDLAYPYYLFDKGLAPEPVLTSEQSDMGKEDWRGGGKLTATTTRIRESGDYLPRVENEAAVGPPKTAVGGGEHPVYFIPTTAAGQGYYAVVQRVASEVHREVAGLYAVGTPPPRQPAKVVGAAGHVALDSTGKGLYYTGVVTTYPMLTAGAEAGLAKPSHVS